MHGARTTRTPSPSRLCKSVSRRWAPASSQLRLSHTRTVSAGDAGLVIHDDVEMGVERGDLVDFDECQPHLLRQRNQMARVEAAEMVLQQVQVLDQQIAPSLAGAKQGLHLGQSRRIDLPALRVVEPAPPSGARMNAAVVSHLRVQ